MVRWIIGVSLRARGFMAAVAAVLVALGIWQVRATKLDALPEFGPPTVQIQTEALGLSAPEVEQLITVPLEQDLLAGIPWLDSMRSESIPGLSSIELVFDPGTDLLRARQVVQERLTQAAGLPNVSGPPQMLQPLSSTSRVMMVRLASDTVSPIELSVLARWTIRPKLLGVPGVANVSIWGMRDRQLQVQVDPAKLRHSGVSLDQVVETSGNALWASPLTFLEASTPGTGGFIDTAQQRLGIQHLQPITTADDLAEVPIEGTHGVLRLGDVASVVEDHQPLIGDAIFTDGRPGLLVVIEKLPDTNTVDVTNGIDDALDALRPGLAGVQMDTSIYRPSSFIQERSRTLGLSLVLVLLVLVLALGALLFDWRSGVIALTAVATSIAVAVLVLYVRHATVNALMLAGLVMALVVVIDDVVIDVDAVRRTLAGRTGNGSTGTLGGIKDALTEMRVSAMSATLIGAAALAPAFFVRGTAAPFLQPALRTFGLAVIASLLVALLITPAMCLLLPPRATEGQARSPRARLSRGYARLLAAVTTAPSRAFVGAGVILLAGLLLLPFMTRSVLPTFPDGDLLLDVQAVPGTSLEEMDRITDRLATELAAVPGVADVGAQIGRAVSSDQVVGVDSAQLWVRLDDAADRDQTVSSVRAVAAAYPGLASNVSTYADERIAQQAGDGGPLTVRLFGTDLGTLQQQADQVSQALASIDGVAGTRIDLRPQQPTVDVRVDLQRAERVGVVPGDVRRAAATLMSGIGVGSLFEQQKVFDVVVWGTPATRNSLESLRTLSIDTATGEQVPLGRVADVSIASTPTVIDHADDARTIDIAVDVAGRSTDAVSADVRAALAGLTYPLEYHAELIAPAASGVFDPRALAVIIAAVIGVFLLFQATFSSWRLAIIAFCAMPFALVGCLFGAAVVGDEVSLGTYLGIGAVTLLAARMLVEAIRTDVRLQGLTGATRDAAFVQRGALDRFGAVVTTSLAVALASVVLAVVGGIEGQEILRPMAAAMVGGVLTTALVATVLIPALYARFGPAQPPTAIDDEIVVVPDIDALAGSTASQEGS